MGRRRARIQGRPAGPAAGLLRRRAVGDVATLRAGLGRIHRERGAERFPQPGEVLVDASALSLDEKVLILLRHAKAMWPFEVRHGLRAVGYTVVSHPHFTPERIRRLVDTRNLAPTRRVQAWRDAHRAGPPLEVCYWR